MAGRIRNEQQRAAWAAYMRRYRAEHPERAAKWQREYILRKAAKIMCDMYGNGNQDCGQGCNQDQCRGEKNGTAQ